MLRKGADPGAYVVHQEVVRVPAAHHAAHAPLLSVFYHFVNAAAAAGAATPPLSPRSSCDGSETEARSSLSRSSSVRQPLCSHIPDARADDCVLCSRTRAGRRCATTATRSRSSACTPSTTRTRAARRRARSTRTGATARRPRRRRCTTCSRATRRSSSRTSPSSAPWRVRCF